MDGVNPHPDQPANPYVGQPLPYPEFLPPPLPYPPPQRGVRTRILVIAAAMLGAIAVLGVVGGVLYAVIASTDHGLSSAEAKTSIQSYLNSLMRQDKQAVARHSLCGLYDQIKDHSTDLTVANLASDAFRRQYSAAEVTSIDKVVMLSSNQAQVLFTMKVTPTGPSLRGAQQPKTEVQAVAQLLVQGDDSLVCAYLPRPGISE